jgi:Crp-like helix-turn-helix domain
MLLGIRRTSVTLLAHALQKKGLIHYRRGKISIRDPAGLEAAACECCGNLGPARCRSPQAATCASSARRAA